jgi:hypothetical protein
MMPANNAMEPSACELTLARRGSSLPLGSQSRRRITL